MKYIFLWLLILQSCNSPKENCNSPKEDCLSLVFIEPADGADAYIKKGIVSETLKQLGVGGSTTSASVHIKYSTAEYYYYYYQRFNIPGELAMYASTTHTDTNYCVIRYNLNSNIIEVRDSLKFVDIASPLGKEILIKKLK